MKNLKKNNKGFSLVELIVVVLIMAIIAVALAPQVLKWVNNSRISSDLQTLDSVKSAVNVALTKESFAKETRKISWTNAGGLSAGDDFMKAVEASLGDSLSNIKNKVATGYSVIDIKNGKIESSTTGYKKDGSGGSWTTTSDEE